MSGLHIWLSFQNMVSIVRKGSGVCTKPSGFFKGCSGRFKCSNLPDSLIQL
ncbi:hypothetical protein BFJ63_vAg16297 [Fusarium oxysporum f. sp. narcissi]|uniref:Uncharacterized protein n=1 Tax=Fusarium oxysporum f. sp. narcissi TaxID=451672 RepID=A0A4Q2V2K3_FUSOX|nr:hypothetical protein BFJ63_vAg16297 [Fusarium oxysporum f. sp. narcissi]